MIIAVIGAGSWGTAMTGLLGEKHDQVFLWARSDDLVTEIRQTRLNNKYLPGRVLPPTIFVTADLAAAVQDADLIIIATPSHAVRATASQLRGLIKPEAVIVSAAKGIETDTYKRMTEVIAEEIPAAAPRLAAISGPNHAEEVGMQHPSATVVAASSQAVAEYVQDAFMSDYFRVYTNPDVAGVELGGALKNIIALGAGISEGLGFGDNTTAALMTRGLAEIVRLGMALGANPLTFAGLSGIGDLMVTCTSRHSRNRRAGIMLAQGKTVPEIVSATNMVVEGIKATFAAYHLAQQYHVEMPITEQTYEVLYQGKSPKAAVLELMTRGRTHEVEEVVRKDIGNW